MANTTITNLPAAISLNGTEQVPAVQSGTTVRLTVAQIASYTASVIQTPTISIGNIIGGSTPGSGLYVDGSSQLGQFTYGSGVFAALQVATGVSGSPVLYNRAGGTPTSLTLTNATGLPVTGILATGVPSATTFLRGDGSWQTVASGGTVTSVSVTTVNGISGTVANSTTTPAISLTLGAITPSSVNGLTLSALATGFSVAGGTTSKTLTVSNTLTLAGTDSSTLNIGAGGTLGSLAFQNSVSGSSLTGTSLNSAIVTSSLTTVGTIGTGVWQGTAVGISYGGTGQTTASAAFNAISPITSTGDLIIGNGTNSATRIAIGTNGYVLTSNGTTATWAAAGGGGSGTVTSVSVTTANGVSGTVANATTTPAITLTLGAITPTSVNGLTLTALATGFSIAGGTTSKTLTVSNTLTLAGTDGSTLNIGAGGTLGNLAFQSTSGITAPVTINEAVGSSALTLVGATQTSSFPVLNMTQTWNNVATTFTAIKLNVTDTTSAAQSALLDLQVGGASKAIITKAGALSLSSGVSASGSITTNNLLQAGAAQSIGWNGRGLLTSPATGSVQLGALDAALPALQTLRVQSVVAGTTDTAGATFTIAASQGTGLGVGGSIVFQVAPAGLTGTAQNALTTALTIDSTKTATFTGTVSTPQVINPNNALTATANAATVPITSRITTVTNNSAATLTITLTLTGAVDGQMIMVRVLDFSAAAQTLTWVNTENSTVSVPTTSNGSTTRPLTVGFQYNANTTKWRCIASA